MKNSRKVWVIAIFVAIALMSQSFVQQSVYDLAKQFLSVKVRNLSMTSVTEGINTDSVLVKRANGVVYKVSQASLAGTGGVPTSRTISPGFGLLGGGDLTANRTLSSDTTKLRSFSNSLSLAQLQTKLNNYVSKTGSNIITSSNTFGQGALQRFEDGIFTGANIANASGVVYGPIDMTVNKPSAVYTLSFPNKSGIFALLSDTNPFSMYNSPGIIQNGKNVYGVYIGAGNNDAPGQIFSLPPVNTVTPGTTVVTILAYGRHTRINQNSGDQIFSNDGSVEVQTTLGTAGFLTMGKSSVITLRLMDNPSGTGGSWMIESKVGNVQLN